MLELRKLNESDIPLIETWLHKDHVKKWYEIPHMGVTLDDWMMEIKERDNQFKWLHHFIVMYEGEAIGLCQYYNCKDSDEDFGDLAVEGSYGIDYLIGEESCVGKGVGKQMIMALIDKIFSLPDALRITADIDERNKASEGVLRSCGFILFDPIQSRYIKEKSL
ncbi:GNAT family N-acetyltransferase [Amedibacillus sp. YH-ame10]